MPNSTSSSRYSNGSSAVGAGSMSCIRWDGARVINIGSHSGAAGSVGALLSSTEIRAGVVVLVAALAVDLIAVKVVDFWFMPLVEALLSDLSKAAATASSRVGCSSPNACTDSVVSVTGTGDGSGYSGFSFVTVSYSKMLFDFDSDHVDDSSENLALAVASLIRIVGPLVGAVLPVRALQLVLLLLVLLRVLFVAAALAAAVR